MNTTRNQDTGSGIGVKIIIILICLALGNFISKWIGTNELPTKLMSEEEETYVEEE